MPPISTAPRSRPTTRSSAPGSMAGGSDSPSSRALASGAGECTSFPLPAMRRGGQGVRYRRDPVTQPARYAGVVLPVPVRRTYTYEIPDGLAERVAPGARVVVPLGRRRVVGVVAALDVPAPDVAAKPIAAAPDAEPALSPGLVELGRWISRYYGTPLGLATRALLPGALWSLNRPGGPAEQAERVLVLAQSLPSLLERERAFRRAPKRRVAYEALEALGGSAPVRHLVTQLRLSPAALDGLVRQRFARYADVPRPRDPFAELSSPPPPALTDAQRGDAAGRSRPAPRRHRLGQDARLSRGAAGRRGGGERCDSPRPGNRAHSSDGRAGAGRLRGPGRGAAFGALGRRARRRLAGAAPRRAACGGWPAVRRVRPGPAARRGRGGRGARARLQAGDGAALPRARRGAGARQARARARDSGQRHAVARNAGPGAGRQHPDVRLARADRRAAAAAGRRHRSAERAPRGGGAGDPVERGARRSGAGRALP